MYVKNRKETNLNDDLLLDAEAVFSKGLVDSLKSRGHDIIEMGGEGAHLIDTEGKRYIDCMNSSGAFNLGRKNQILIDALQDASRKTDQGIFACVSQEKINLAEALIQFVSGDFVGVMPQVSRGEIIDAACKISRGHTGREELIAVRGSWHGQTGFATTLSDDENKYTFGSLIGNTKILPEDAVLNAISTKTAAVVIEPIQAENHCRTFSNHYLKQLRTACDKHGALLIFDESQTGLGRTGYKFAYEASGVTPDILTMGEAISGGMFPITAMVYTQAVKTFFDKYPLRHMSTFGGHDVGCLVVCDVLEEYQRAQPWNQARIMGEKLRTGLESISKENSDLLQGVDGQGLLLALRLSSEQAAQCFSLEARKAGLIVTPGLVDKSSVIFRPSLSITLVETDTIIAACKQAVLALSKTQVGGFGTS